jgi:peptidoglycan hydrolase-like protein with peptidoglycan-binding domain
MSIPEDVRAACSNGDQIGGPYNEGSTNPVYVYRKGGAVYFTSGMSIDCDGQPGSLCNPSSDPYFQPNTAFNQSNGQPLKAEELPYVVLPLKSSRWDYTSAGIRGGDLVVMVYRDKYVFGVVGDLGPSQRIGEGSYAAAAALGVNPNPRTGGVASGVTYVVFPGVRVSPIESKAEAVRLGTAKLAEWLGTSPGEEEPPVTTPLSGADKMVAFAETTLGMSDQNNTVRTPVHTWYNAKFGNPDPGKYAWDWCDGWITYVAWQTGNQAAVVFGGAFAYTVAHAQAFKDRGQWHVDTAGIRRGDIVFFDWDGSNNISAIDHVGLCVGVNADGTVQTIEGNIENAVRRKTRSSSTIVGYGRPNYTGGTTPPPDNGGGTVATVKLSDAQAHTAAATRVIQDALNREFGGVVVDGDYGPQTTAAYTRWQQSLGWPGDGEPGAHSLWSLARKYGFSTDITGTPAGPGGQTTTPPPTPTPDPEPEVPVIYFEDTGPNGTVAANKVVQTALNKWKPSPALVVDGIFGPVTSARYKEWQESLYGPGPDSDGVPGVSSLTSLGARSAYPFTVKRKTTTPPPVVNPPQNGTPDVADYLTVPEPAHNYTRTTYGGKTVNVRTRDMLRLAATWAGVSITLTQGSYNRGVAASAGTHDGGGVVDINVNAWSASTRSRVVLALRKAGFAAWLRTPAEGFSYHIHACAIGDREMAAGAKRQVQAYFNRRNGLANNGADNSEHRWPNWADKYNQ